VAGSTKAPYQGDTTSFKLQETQNKTKQAHAAHPSLKPPRTQSKTRARGATEPQASNDLQITQTRTQAQDNNSNSNKSRHSAMILEPIFIDVYRFGMAAGLHFGTFGLTFSALRGSLGAPWGTLGLRHLKTSKKTFLGTSFWSTFWYNF
jgi:hypothetical protein